MYTEKLKKIKFHLKNGVQLFVYNFVCIFQINNNDEKVGKIMCIIEEKKKPSW